jgi:acetyl-CoA carboxylase biotin carboxylase subunit
MIQRVLIANRGEIASRIIRTCKKMGIKTAAVYSEADQHALHVLEADESYLIGPAPVNQSYLNINAMIDAAKKFSADAIHPGYGFLSENDQFAKRCQEEELIFIGPDSDVMKQMGSKIEARKVLKEAGVPIVPGTEGAVSDVEEARRYADDIGYPVMLKAAAGGGGIGMEEVSSPEELSKAFENNSKRAEAFFGNGAMFIEKKIEQARHIEIQLLADHYGNIVHLFERDCSIQRRNQKVVEEAPSIFISEVTRKAMGEAAVNAARALSYTNAGTVEFLVDEEENFYFLEMNTRIQVEHPVTEEITSIDLVDEQIKIAQGDPLSFNQESLDYNGHAIEVRIYAEDPKTFFPSPGKIDRFDYPKGDHIRNEVSVQANDQVTHYYDPMIAKLIIKGSTREEALQFLGEALDQYEVTGIKTNIPMLKKTVGHEVFQQGKATISFVRDYYIPQLKEEEE